MNVALDKADLERGVLVGAKLIATDFSEANLRAADLSGADVGLVNFNGADIRGAKMMCLRIGSANFDGALIDDETIFPEGFVFLNYRSQNDRK